MNLPNFWRWLSQSKNQKTIAWLGGGLFIAVSGFWQAYVYFSDKPKDDKPLITSISASNGGIVSRGNVLIGEHAVVQTGSGTINIGITLEQFETRLKRREHEVRTELNQAVAADKDKIALLEKQLADIQAKLNSPESALEENKTKLTQAYQAFDELKGEVLPEQIKQARQELTQGKTANAEVLFKQVLASGTENAAQAAYQLGELAENRIDYATAEGYFSKAAQLQPNNTQYLNDAGRLALFVCIPNSHAQAKAKAAAWLASLAKDIIKGVVVTVAVNQVTGTVEAKPEPEPMPKEIGYFCPS
ncbi:tetratricopeptide repeat protein, partial [Methylomonas methanica]|uniref:tetratricopeptide repeat protein n=1 Tax=Methylomonas methanica TaxID=421 RepID=UPI0018D376DE